MRSAIALTVTASLLAACGPKVLALPDSPVDRAATCGVVAAADARKGGGDVSKPLTLEQSGRILHYPMLAASEGATFASDTAAAVVARMPVLEGDITRGKWADLVAPCDAAYPAAAATTPVTLPADTLDAQLGCSVLGEYLSKALASQEAAYGDDLFGYRQLGTSLDQRVASKLGARGIEGFDATKTARDKALAKVVKIGSPVPVMKACIAKYGETG